MAATIPMETITPPAVHTVMTFVTPAQAQLWLRHNNPRNRHITKATVDQMAHDILHNRWATTHQGIAFTEDGVLVDGQHRLSAIVQAGVGIWMNVSRYLAEDSIMLIDHVRPRTSADTLTLVQEFGSVSKDSAAILYRMIAGLSRVKVRSSVLQQKEEYAKHRGAIDYAITNIPTRVGLSAPVRAAVARAYYVVNRDKLTRFCEVLRSGMAERDGEQVIAVLYRELVSTRSHVTARYGKTERAIVAYIEGVSLTRLYCPDKELFPFADAE